MNKNILLFVCLIVTILSAGNAFMKNDEANKRAMELELAQQEAVRNAEEAARQEEMASSMAAEVMNLLVRTEKLRQELQNCKSQ